MDPLAVYNPVQETEFYFDGQHNGGIYNGKNLNVYGYCYQNPIKYVDPNGKQVDAVRPKTVNVYISQSLWPNVYNTHLMGIAKGNSTLITYDSDRVAARSRRAQAQTTSGLSRIPEQHLDEYPYASTKEGGAGAAVNSVPAKENMQHGGYLGGLVVANKMETGDKFNIILIPSAKEPEPVPDPILIPTLSFREKIAAATGLTGAALTIYIIISEGSRIIPARNLIPVP